MCCHPGRYWEVGEMGQQEFQKFNKGKHQVLHQMRNISMHQYNLGTYQIESSFAEKDLKAMVDSKFMLSQWCALEAKKANNILADLKSISSMSRKVVFPSAQHWWGHIWSSGFSEELWRLLKNWSICQMRRGWYLGVFSPEKWKLVRDLINVYKLLMRGFKEDRTSLFSLMASDKKRYSEHKLKKIFFTMREVGHLKGWSRVSVESPFLKTSKAWLDMALGNLL